MLTAKKKLFDRKSQVRGVNWNIPCRGKKLNSSKLQPSPHVILCLNSSLKVQEWLAHTFVLLEVIKINKVAVSSCFLSVMRQRFYFGSFQHFFLV